MNQTAIIKGLGLLLILVIAPLSVSLLVTKPVFAQSDTTPTVSILYPTDSTVFNVSIEGVYFQLLYQTNDTLSWVGFSINGGGNVTCTGNVTDSNEFFNDGYQFDFGHPTLTLYANDTAGNWATPQTVTYTADFYPDTTASPSSSPHPTPTPTSSPTVPELSWFTIVPLLFSLFSVAAATGFREQVKGRKNLE